jgi:hypothetical protein
LNKIIKALALGMHFPKLVNMLQQIKKIVKTWYIFLFWLHKEVEGETKPTRCDSPFLVHYEIKYTRKVWQK